MGVRRVSSLSFGVSESGESSTVRCRRENAAAVKQEKFTADS